MTDGRTALLARSFLPETAVLEVTYSCNHRCLFCSCPWEAPGSGFSRDRELTIEEWKEVASLLVGMGVTTLALSGGEPLAKPGIWELVRHLAALPAQHVEVREGRLATTTGPPRLNLVSNGSLVDREVLQRCREFGVDLSISLPGLETYSRHTGCGSPEPILERFALAGDLGIPATVNVAVTRLNLGELFETISAAFLAGAGSLLLNRFLPGGRGLVHTAELSLTVREVNEMLATAEEVLSLARRSGSVGTELPRCILHGPQTSHLRVASSCSAAKGFFVVGPSGRIRTCNHSPVELEPVWEIDAVEQNPYWRRFAFGDYRPRMCAGCPVPDCDGGCREAAHVTRGAIDAPDVAFSGVQRNQVRRRDGGFEPEE